MSDLAFSAFAPLEGLMHILINLTTEENSPLMLMLFQGTCNNFDSVCLLAGTSYFSKHNGVTTVPGKMANEFWLNNVVIVGSPASIGYGPIEVNIYMEEPSSLYKAF